MVSVVNTVVVRIAEQDVTVTVMTGTVPVPVGVLVGGTPLPLPLTLPLMLPLTGVLEGVPLMPRYVLVFGGADGLEEPEMP